jgi:hypothetical protein
VERRSLLGTRRVLVPRRPYRDAANPWLAADTMLEYIVKISGPGMAAEAPVMGVVTRTAIQSTTRGALDNRTPTVDLGG